MKKKKILSTITQTNRSNLSFTQEKKQKQALKLISEQNLLQLKVFLPFCIVLALSIGFFIAFIQYIYLIPMSSNMEIVIWNNYKKYIKSISRSERITLILTYQQITAQIQIIGGFMKMIMINQVNIADLVTWEPDSTGSYSQKTTNNGQVNFRDINFFRASDICPYEDYFLSNSDFIQNYQLNQFYGWYNWKENIWEKLTENQRVYLIKSYIIQSISQIFFQYQRQQYITNNLFYNEKQSDELYTEFPPTNELITNKFYNSEAFGGPFSCTKQKDGNYKEYILPNSTYFFGKDQNNNDCPKNKMGSCQCSFYEENRVFPIVWRCRPWYIASSLNSYLTFAETYPDINNGKLSSTISIKIVNSTNLNSINEEDDAETFAIQSIDFNLDQLQKNYGQGNETNEYSYFVAPSTFNYDDIDGSYYQYTALVHPQLSGIVKQSILELEFENSTFSEVEKKSYIEKTQFLINTTVRYSGCNPFLNIANYEEIIVKNGTNYFTLFEDVVVCYGNMEEQKTITVGYLGKAISEERKYVLIKEIADTMRKMKISIITTLFLCFAGSFVCLAFFQKEFMSCNFEVPIQILSSVIQNSSPQEVHKLSTSIEKGEISMQLELRNLLFAIDQVVIGVQTKVQEDINSKDASHNSDNYDYQMNLFQSALSTFIAVDHKIGMGLCFNNIGNIFNINNEFKKALFLYSQALQLSKEQYYEEIDLKKQQNLNSIEKLSIHESNANFFKIFASRKFQIACTLIKEIKKMKNKNFYEEPLVLWEQEEVNYQTERDRILSINEDEFNKNFSFQLKQGKLKQMQGDIDQKGCLKESLEPSIIETFEERVKQNDKDLQINSSVLIFQKDTQNNDLFCPIQIGKNDLKQDKLNFQLNEETKLNLERIQEQFFIQKNKIEKEDMADQVLQFQQNETKFLWKDQENNIVKKSQEKYNRLSEAIDLLEDTTNIFSKLNEFYINLDESESFEQVFMVVLSQLKLCECQLLIGQFIALAKTLLRDAKWVIKNKLCGLQKQLNQKKLRVLLKPDVLISKYYLLKAKIRIEEQEYAKAIKNLLQCLCFCEREFEENDFSLYSYFSSKKLKHFDPLDVLEALKLIEQIIKQENIKIQTNERMNIDNDIIKFEKISKEFSELYFFEVFYREKSEINYSYQIIQEDN